MMLTYILHNDIFKTVKGGINMKELTAKDVAAYFDHTCLKADAINDDLIKLCTEAKTMGAAMVAINTEWVPFCKEQLKGTSVHVGAAIGFPLGQCGLETKLFETNYAIDLGADEIDYVINISKAKMQDWDFIKDEIKPDFIKTSTGFGTGGATLEDVQLMIDTVAGEVAVKAAGGIRDWQTAKAMIDLGVKRIGTSSSLKILEEFKEAQK